MKNGIAPQYNLACNFRKNKGAFVCILKSLQDYHSMLPFPGKGTQNKKSKEKILEIIS